MNEIRRAIDAAELKKGFQSETKDKAPFMCLPITSENELATEERLTRLMQEYKKAGYCGVLPYLPDKETVHWHNHMLLKDYYCTPAQFFCCFP